MDEGCQRLRLLLGPISQTEFAMYSKTLAGLLPPTRPAHRTTFRSIESALLLPFGLLSSGRSCCVASMAARHANLKTQWQTAYRQSNYHSITRHEALPLSTN